LRHGVRSSELRRGFRPNATHATNLRNLRISEITQAPANRNRNVLYPAELEFLRFKLKKESIVQISVRFLLVVQRMVQIKFNFNNFARVCHSLAACQRHTPSSLAAVIGLYNKDVISLRALRLNGNPASDVFLLTWRGVTKFYSGLFI